MFWGWGRGWIGAKSMLIYNLLLQEPIAGCEACIQAHLYYIRTEAPTRHWTTGLVAWKGGELVDP